MLLVSLSISQMRLIQLTTKYYLIKWKGIEFEVTQTIFFKSYLNNRKAYIVTNAVESYIRDLECGLPQGSVVGPLLFSLYMNDICRAVGQDYIRLFALFVYDENLNSPISNVVSKLNELFLWCVKNKLTINYDKTNFTLSHATNNTSQYRNKWMKLLQVIWLSKESNHFSI